MNDYLKILFFILFTHVSFSQIYEVGFTFGKSNFIGDVGSTTFINPNENLFGGVLNGIGVPDTLIEFHMSNQH